MEDSYDDVMDASMEIQRLDVECDKLKAEIERLRTAVIVLRAALIMETDTDDTYCQMCNMYAEPKGTVSHRVGCPMEIARTALDKEGK